MRLRSLIITIVALFVIANVIVAAMRRCGVVPDVADAPAVPTDGASAEGERAPAASDAPEAVDLAVAAAVSSEARPPAGIEGLQLQLSRPLMFDIGALGGLAADDEHLYVAAWDDGAGAAVLYQVYPDSYTISQVRALPEDGATAVGGIDAGAGLVWVPLLRGGGAPTTVVVGIDGGTLEPRERFEVAEGLAALAAGDGGRVYGVSLDGATWFEWLPDGTRVREATSTGWARYADLAGANGSLVAAGTDGASGVLDVIDPLGLTLLARHACVAEGNGSVWVTGGGVEVRDGAVLLLPEGGARPSLLSYVPEGSDMAGFAPAVAADR